MYLRQARQVLAAGKSDERVSDHGGPLPGHSIFTGYFLEALQGQAVDTYGILTASNVMSYVHQKVSRDQYSQQTPHYGFIDGDGDFVFLAPILDTLNNDIETNKDLLVEVQSFEPLPEDQGAKLSKLIEAIKLYIADARYKIRLHDEIMQHVREVSAAISTEEFSTRSNVTVEALIARLKKYEGSVLNIQAAFILLCHWGTKEHLPSIRKSLLFLADQNKEQGGNSVWLALRWYPLVLLVYSGCISAIDAENYELLAAVFNADVASSFTTDNTQNLTIVLGEAIGKLERYETFKKLPGHENNYTPRSEYLFKLLQPILEDTLYLGRSYEMLFDRFEVLLALVHAHLYEALPYGAIWGPWGRFTWKYHRLDKNDSIFRKIMSEAETLKNEWGPLKAGLFNGNYERFAYIAQKFEEEISKSRFF